MHGRGGDEIIWEASEYIAMGFLNRQQFILA